jgi:hypothetical protein
LAGLVWSRPFSRNEFLPAPEETRELIKHFEHRFAQSLMIAQRGRCNQNLPQLLMRPLGVPVVSGNRPDQSSVDSMSCLKGFKSWQASP